ncbi:4,5-DOPA-extradiol-dioxygenase [Anaeromicropila herbilytica]|uniref:Dioxygenase n=1 Tax=Anaeromicropila herbilytica TaxID=2785025 RepID=A0A7R7EIJ3_9FIRM|nr:4,5-DOPA dioxygenase extradiol [Anaeromicropila herbilytica]BCN29379.1 dioxygenase [Anaeromicropila herbilytica]
MTDSNQIMPVLFIGHGSPMNAIEDNQYSKGWEKIALDIPKPKAILAISAHWYTKGTRVQNNESPRMIYDMYGFPEELYQIDYPAKGATKLAQEVKGLLNNDVTEDHTWGYDHGIWSVLHKMYPKADIPLCELSINADEDAEYHYQLGQKLSSLREQGVLILASGNVVHNLSRVNFDMEDGYPWAKEFDSYIKNNILTGNYQNVIDYHKAGDPSKYAFTTPEHFYPLLSILGATREGDKVTIYNDSCTMGSLSMTSYLFQ